MLRLFRIARKSPPLLFAGAFAALLLTFYESSSAQPARSTGVYTGASELSRKLNELDPELLETVFTQYSSHIALTPGEQARIKRSFSEFLTALRQNKIKHREAAETFVSDVIGGKFSHFLILEALKMRLETSLLPDELKAEIVKNLTRFAEGMRRGTVSQETAREIFGRTGELNDQRYKEIGDALGRSADQAGVENKHFRLDLAQEIDNAVRKCLS